MLVRRPYAIHINCLAYTKMFYHIKNHTSES